MAESKEELKNLLMRVKQEREKAGLKFNIQKTKVMAHSPISSWQIEGKKVEAVTDFICLGSQITVDSDCHHEIKRCLLLGRKAMTNLGSVLKKQRHYFASKGLYSKSYGFSSSHVWMWELDHKESWELKNWCVLTVVLEKTLGSPLHCKEIKLVNPNGKQPWIFTGRTDAEAPIFWPPDAKSRLIGKDLEAGNDGGRRGWQKMRWLDSSTNSMDMNLCKLQKTVEESSLACCSPWGRKESDTTE